MLVRLVLSAYIIFYSRGEISRENENKKRKTAVFTAVLLLCRHRLIFPGRFQPSIVSTDELNYRVRDGNGWTLIAKDTDLRLRYCAFVSFSLAIIHAQGAFVNSYFDIFCKILSFFEKLCRKKRKTAVFTAVLLLCRHRLIFPGRFQPSIVSTDELNYRVRDGNGWTLIAKNTDLRLRYSVLVSFSVGIIYEVSAFVNRFLQSF